MVLKSRYPICEFDTSKNPIIQPANFLAESLPEKCVITFFRKELDQFVAENHLPVIAYLNSEVFDIPVYDIEDFGDGLKETVGAFIDR